MALYSLHMLHLPSSAYPHSGICKLFKCPIWLNTFAPLYSIYIVHKFLQRLYCSGVLGHAKHIICLTSFEIQPKKKKSSFGQSCFHCNCLGQITTM